MEWRVSKRKEDKVGMVVEGSDDDEGREEENQSFFVDR